MSNDIIKIAVKVGNKSDIRFSSRAIKAYRAITINELKYIIGNKGVSILIIENIKQAEYESLRSLIEEFKEKDSTNRVLFYVKDNDEITCGMADEFVCDIYLNLEDLHRGISNITGKKVSIAINNSKIDNIDDIFDIGFEGTFDGDFGGSFLEDADNNGNEREQENISEIQSESKDELLEEETNLLEGNDGHSEGDLENEIITDENVDKTEESGESKESTLKHIEMDSQVENETSLETESEQIEEVDIIEEDVTVDKNNDIAFSKKENNGKLVSVTGIEVNKADETKYNNLLGELETAKVKLENANKEIDNLNGVVEALEDERNTYKKMISDIEKNDNVIEEPIGLSEYQSLKEELQDIKDRYNQLKDNDKEREQGSKELEQSIGIFKAEVEGLNVQINKYKAHVVLLETENKELKQKVEQLEQREVEFLQAKGEYEQKEEEFKQKEEEFKQKSDSFIQRENEFSQKEYEFSIKKSEFEQSEVDFNARQNEFNTKEGEFKEKEAGWLESKTEMEKTIQSLNNEIDDLKDKKTELDNTILGLNDTIRDLTLKTGNVDTLIKQAIEKEQAEVNRLTLEKVEIEGKYKLLASQLEAMTYQYNTLMRATGTDAEGAKSIMENNRTLESITRSLRDQVVSLKNDVEKERKEKIFAIQNAKNLEEVNKSLKDSLDSITAGVASGGGISMSNCTYSGKGFIIPVFGCGSYGITTTAMSLATRLGTESNVLYIDFDMAIPKADSWFRKKPIIDTLPINERPTEGFTGLGLFIDRGVQFFLNYSNNLIVNAVTNKGGKIDYLSGLYSRPDTIKLISADYTTFFNYCGNNYDYVIIDFGRLGSSELTDSIIKMVSDIAYRNIVVTTKDLLEVRTFSMKLREAKIPRVNIAWELNLCKDTKLDVKIKNHIGTDRFGMIPIASSIYGEKSPFTKDRVTRDKFDLFMNKIFDR